MRVDQAKANKNTWKPLQNTVYWCNSKLAQEKGLQLYRTRSHAIVLHDTRSRRLHWEGGMYENEGGALPKSTLNSKMATVGTRSEFAQRSIRSRRKSESKSYRETSNDAVDYRIPGMPFRQSNSRIQIAKTRSRSWSKSSRTTSTRSQTQKIDKFSKESQDWPPKWTTPRSSSFAKTLPKSNAPIAIPTGKSALSFAVVKEILNPRRDQKSSKRTTTTSPQSLAVLLRKIAVAVPNMDLLNDKECTTRLKRCCKKLAKKSTEAIHPCLHDGTTTTSTESLCQILDGPRST